MRERIQRFMQGRYGIDQYSGVLAWITLILWVIARFTRYILLGRICFFGTIVLMVYVCFRIFSKNCARRYAENEHYLIMTGRVRRHVQKWQYQWQMRREHRIFKCPSCHQKIRVPKGKGKIAITCPMCRTEFIKRS